MTRDCNNCAMCNDGRGSCDAEECISGSGWTAKYEKPRTIISALAKRVLVVACPGGRGDDWTVYINAVPGMDHDDESRAVAERGAKLPKKLAVVMFPQFDPATYRL